LGFGWGFGVEVVLILELWFGVWLGFGWGFGLNWS
jgi:hypothetical protein